MGQYETDMREEQKKQSIALSSSLFTSEAAGLLDDPPDPVQQAKTVDYSHLITDRAPITAMMSKNAVEGGLFRSEDYAEMAQAEAELFAGFGQEEEPDFLSMLDQTAQIAGTAGSGIAPDGMPRFDVERDDIMKRLTMRAGLPSEIQIPVESLKFDDIEQERTLASALNMDMAEFRRHTTSRDLLTIASEKLPSLVDQPWWKEMRSSMASDGAPLEIGPLQNLKRTLMREAGALTYSAAYSMYSMAKLASKMGVSDEWLGGDWEGDFRRLFGRIDVDVAKNQAVGVPRLGDDILGGLADPNWWAGAGAQGAMSAARTILTVAITKSPTLGMMSNSTWYAGQRYHDMIGKGVSPENAINFTLATSAQEMLFDRIGIGLWWKQPGNALFRGLRGASGEGFTEYVQEMNESWLEDYYTELDRTGSMSAAAGYAANLFSSHLLENIDVIPVSMIFGGGFAAMQSEQANIDDLIPLDERQVSQDTLDDLNDSLWDEQTVISQGYNRERNVRQDETSDKAAQEFEQEALQYNQERNTNQLPEEEALSVREERPLELDNADEAVPVIESEGGIVAITKEPVEGETSVDDITAALITDFGESAVRSLVGDGSLVIAANPSVLPENLQRDNATAAYDPNTGTMYIVASNVDPGVAGRYVAYALINHEVVHADSSSIWGSDTNAAAVFGQFMRKTEQALPADGKITEDSSPEQWAWGMAQRNAQEMAESGRPVTPAETAEEATAYFMQHEQINRRSPAMYRRIVSQIKKLMVRKLGPQAARLISNDDIASIYITAVRQKMRRQGRPWKAPMTTVGLPDEMTEEGAVRWANELAGVEEPSYSLRDLSEADQQVVWDHIDSRADGARVRANMERHMDTAWERSTTESTLIRASMEAHLEGREAPAESRLDLPATKNQLAAIKKGPEGIWNYLTNRGFVGNSSKPVRSVQSSYLNCNPSENCAKYCYACNGLLSTTNSLIKGEFISWAIEQDPVRAAQITAQQYKSTAEGISGKALRLLDKGELSAEWVSYIAELNRQGVRAHVFSRRADLLRQIDDSNVRMLSIDSTNRQLAVDNPDLRLAVVYEGRQDNQYLLDNEERIQLVLPIVLKTGDKYMNPEEWADAPAELVKNNFCPIDSSKQSLKKGYNCTKCDRGKGIGCYHGQASGIINKKNDQPFNIREYDDAVSQLQQLRDRVGSDSELGRRLTDALGLLIPDDLSNQDPTEPGAPKHRGLPPKHSARYDLSEQELNSLYTTEPGAEQVSGNANLPPLTAQHEWDKVTAEARQLADVEVKKIYDRTLKRLKADAKRYARNTLSEHPVMQLVAEAVVNGGLNLTELQVDYEKATTNQIRKLSPKLLLKKGKMSPDEFASDQGMSLDDLVTMLYNFDRQAELQKIEDDFMAENEPYHDQYMDDTYEELLLENESKILARLTKGNKAKRRSSIKSFIDEEIVGKNRAENMITESKALEASFIKATQAARKAFSEGKKDEAFKQNERRREMLARVRAANRVSRENQEMRRKLKKLATAKVVSKGGTIPDEHKLHIDGILVAAGIISRKQMAMPASGTVEVFLREQESKGIEVGALIADNEALPRDRGWGKMTHEERQGLYRLATGLAHIGRTGNKLFQSGKQIAIENVRGKLILGMLENIGPVFAEPQSMIGKGVRGLETRYEWYADTAHLWREFFAFIKKPSFIYRALDGFKGYGPWQSLIMRSQRAAQDRSLELTEEKLGEVESVFEPFLSDSGWARKKFNIQVSDIEVRSMTKEQMIMAALNTGNEGNIAGLEATGITRQGARNIMSNLTPAELDLVDQIWEIIGSMRPLLNDVHLALFGSNMSAVEGNYFPLKFDPKSEFGRMAEEQSQAKDMFAAEYSPATSVRAQFMIARKSGKKYPILLEFNVITKHLADTIHYTSHAEMISNTQKLLRDAATRSAVVAAVGEEMYGQLMPSLRHIARPYSQMLDPIDRIVKRLARNFSVAALGANIGVGLKQTLSYTQTVDEVGFTTAAKAMALFVKNPKGSIRMVHEMSPTMKNRSNAIDQELTRQFDKFNTGKIKNAHNWIQDFSFILIRINDSVASTPTWMAGFSQAQELYPGDLPAQVAHADGVVENTQPSSRQKDLSAIQQQKGKIKAITMFYGFLAVYQNRMAETVHRQMAQGSKATPRTAKSIIWNLAIPAAALQVVNEAWRGMRGFDDEDDPYYERYLKTLLGMTFSGIPGARDVTSALFSGYGYKMSPLSSGGESVARVYKDLMAVINGEKDFDEVNWLNVLALMGYAVGIPSGGIKSAVQAVENLVED